MVQAWRSIFVWFGFDIILSYNIYVERDERNSTRHSAKSPGYEKGAAVMRDSTGDRKLDRDLAIIRKNFPILEKCVYLISNSLGAVPIRTKDALDRYYTLWAEEGVSAWEKEWWGLSRKVGDMVASLIGAEKDHVAMMTNATLCHWVALSTQFASKERGRDTIVMTDHDFPSVIYAVSRICAFMNWKLELIESPGMIGIDADEIIKRVNEKTLLVATSHVYFKTAYIQDISRIAHHARSKGVLTLIDGYHAPGTVPVDVKKLGVDFYVAGCLKWLCGGPGNAFLYVRPELERKIEPGLTGWLAHKNPFAFSRQMEFSDGAYRLMSGTPPIPSLYTAMAGLEIIQEIGMESIRRKSIGQTKKLIQKASERGFEVYTPIEDDLRGGAVSIGVPDAHLVKQALVMRNVKVDFRKGQNREPDVIRVGPHFYTDDAEIELFFQLLDEIIASGEYKKFDGKTETVT
jgi:kynureninase